MSESTRQAAVMAAIEPLFAEGSILINDYRTPQTASRDRAPWAIIALADEIDVTPGPSWSTPSARYGVLLNLLDYRRGRNDKTILDSFQTLRQQVVAALIAVPYLATNIQTQTPVGPFFTEELEIDPDSITQRLVIEVTDYEVE